mmetsp:Transcript_35516/g.43508  ORF Transcript_35516/g.43508 Transcript_35516/m.43508 type:complete len:107 (-) Transcript_35516:176-496(-)|eukprot:CAMPEP_0170473408 /NCGR_PEP_ID=MMETSP0123-20130129/15313_1 /TAXON_ID=182087 /ORGANISM="Favella ehrenbergii, Strain Fehren 1" /LENGTH=106 /DNA_ID=CAMNT_0010742397 /DNA_START=1099 /DNA_END=1419 /DNA_ORIENTATION=+
MACSTLGQVYQGNVAMPWIQNYYSPVEALKRELESTAELSASEKDLIYPCGYGHMADGDVQISLGIVDKGETGREVLRKVSHIADRFLLDYVKKHGGSITGEHGVG